MKRYHWICLAVALAVVLLAAPAWAAEELPEWRKIWDVVWRVLNFLILAGLIVKYGRQPMKDFLAGQRDTLAEEIKEMEEAKAEAEADLKDIEDRIAGLADELGKFEESVASQAAKVREEIMATAEFEANAILERTKRQSEMAWSRPVRTWPPNWSNWQVWTRLNWSRQRSTRKISAGC